MIWRRGLMILGAILLLFGLFFALQGADVIHWPQESTMLGHGVWIRNGLVIAAIGAAMLFGARRIR